MSTNKSINVNELKSILDIKLTEKENNLLKANLKKGIYLRLYHKGFLNESQLIILIDNINKSIN